MKAGPHEDIGTGTPQIVAVDGAFVSLTSQTTPAAMCQNADDVEQNVPIYDCGRLIGQLGKPSFHESLRDEWTRLLLDGPGVFVLRRAFANRTIDDATSVFYEILEAEKRSGQHRGDHFAKPGANERIWNALEKLCLRSPHVFARYYANPFIALASKSWLGPNYQVTSQVNLVKPGGQAQDPHRDYHLGFQSPGEAQQYPSHAQQMSALLTLQGAVAHVDMPLDSGPTRVLPFSQRYRNGYLVWRHPVYRAHFQANYVQLPLSKGDAMILSPAVFHAAGDNTTRDVDRLANLLQISSAFGRAMETVDRSQMCMAVYNPLGQMVDQGELDIEGRDHVIAACAEGYSFPTNLDRDPPVDGLPPLTQKSLMLTAFEQHWSQEKLSQMLRDHALRRET